MEYFWELNTEDIKNYLVILDIDGTITFDGSTEVESRALSKIKELKTHNELLMLSNSKNLARNKAIAQLAGVSYIDTRHRKPRKKILKAIDNGKGLEVLVIGDKFLTDELFALRIGAKFIKVKRMVSPSESIKSKILYGIDNVSYNLIMKYLLLMRPLQWVKNFLIFVPLFFARGFFSAAKLAQTTEAFLVFCAIASSMYIVNDIIDRDQDKLHPKKKTRPIASSKVSVTAAIVLATLLMVLGLSVVYFFVPQIIFIVLLYVLLNIFYSFYLKKVVILDVLVVSVFYLLRIEAGGLATQTPISRWLILCLIFASLLIVLGKRRAEHRHVEKRKVLDDYSENLINSLLNISAGLTVVSYGLYSVLAVSSPLAVYSIFFVLLGIFRYLFMVYDSRHEIEFPEKMIFFDKVILGSIISWVVFMYLIFYF